MMTAPFTGSGVFMAMTPQIVNLGGVGSLAVSVTDAQYPIPGEWPDWERVLIDLLTPIAPTYQSLPLTVADIQAALPLIFVRRMGGGLDFNAITDRAHMKAVCFGLTRAASFSMAQQVRQAFADCQGGVEVNGVLVDFAEPISGVTEMIDIDPQMRTEEVDCFFYGRRQFPPASR